MTPSVSSVPAVLLALFPALQQPAKPAGALDIPFQKFTLDNGLQVVIHEDHSDPVVAVYVSYHVGSAREELGRSGFAHLFEHMLFQGSQHVGDDQHFKLISEAGGTLNGTTNLDRTLYFETLPSNQLELALWLEADRMGFLIPAMTQAKLDNQRDVVKNERRQNYENRPYAQSESAIVATMYPPDHPYSWVTIGSQKDLSAASLEDVTGFFRRWYGPNNATLAIGGDVKTDEALALVKKYFGTLPTGPRVDAPVARPAKFDQSTRIVVEDKVKLPQIVMTWPGVTQGSPDDAALGLLASVLGQGKSAVLEKAFRLDENLARNVSAQNESSEIAGGFQITITAAPGVSLDRIEAKLVEELERLANTGVSAEKLAQLKTRAESAAVRRFETVGGKTSSLCTSNMFYGDPNHAARALERTLAVTPVQVTDALKKYVLGKPAVICSVVPAGKTDMAASGRSPVQSAKEMALDRGKKPEAGARPSVHAPALWHESLDNGVKAVGARYSEIPLTTLALSVPAGHRFETMDKLGLASLTASLMGEGTKKLSTTELSDALEGLGATLNVSADDDEITLTLSVLNKNLPAAIALFRDVLLEPRFDAKDFERIKRQRLIAIDTRGENIRAIAGGAWSRLLNGEQSVEGMPSNGTRETVSTLSLDDVKRWYAEHVAPTGARLTFVGDLDGAGVKALLAPIATAWKASSAATPAAASAVRPAQPPAIAKSQIFLIDKPGAAQSEIRIGHLSVASTDPDYYPLTVLNYVLGGAFSSRINMNLRESKGYTYGARSNFEGGPRPGAFTTSGGIHTQFTKESIVEFMKELKAILDGVTDDEMRFAKSALAQSQALAYESPAARLGLLNNVSKLGFKDNYPEERMALLDKVTTADLKALAQKYVHPDAMAILVVGDKAKVLDGLNALGYGPVIELDIDGARGTAAKPSGPKD